MITGPASLRTSALVLIDNGSAHHDVISYDQHTDTEREMVTIAEPIHAPRAAVPALIDQLAQRGTTEHPHLLKFVGVVELSPKEYGGGVADFANDQERTVSPQRPRHRQLHRPVHRHGLDPRPQDELYDVRDALGRSCVFLASVWESCRPPRDDDLVNPAAALGTSRLQQVMPIALAVAQAAQFLADDGVVHGSVRYENVVVDATDGRVKLACFDWLFGVHEPSIRCCNRVSPKIDRYAAPELRRQTNDTGNRAASFAGDVYTIGLLVLELATGEPVFGTATDEEIEALVESGSSDLRPEDPSIVTEEEWCLLSALLAADPDDRPSIDDVVNMFMAIANGRAAALMVRNGRQSPGVGSSLVFPRARRHGVLDQEQLGNGGAGGPRNCRLRDVWKRRREG